jgi:hypothetical protein
MNSQAGQLIIGLVAAMILGACAPTYSPPPERHASDRCPIGEVLVCTDHYPSRLDREHEVPPICRCERPEMIR